MLKRFVNLNSNISPSKNPYEVRTYIGDNGRAPDWQVEVCHYERICQKPANSTISKVLTIEDEIRRLHQKADETRFLRGFKKKCDPADEFLMCVVPQRTPQELHLHAIMRERYLRTQRAMVRRVHDAREDYSRKSSVVKLNSPVQSDEEEEAESEDIDEEDEEEGGEEETKEVKPEFASPSCSIDQIFIPSARLLALKRPKSGLFHKMTTPPNLPDDLPYSTYNPRALQEEVDCQDIDCYDVIEGRDPNDLWTWNVGLQKNQTELDTAMKEATMPRLDCDEYQLTYYNIPPDLEKTFTGAIVLGNDAVRLEKPRRKPRSFYRPMEIACVFAAYVESFRLNPDFWTAETMDGILLTADKLHTKSSYLNYKGIESEFDILPQIVEKNSAVDLKAHYTGPLRDEPNIYKALAIFFSRYNAAVLISKNLYMLIWKRCLNSFYVFDPNGRDSKCLRDFEDGKCSLMAMRYVEHLVHLIVNFSDTNLCDDFTLYEIDLINYGKLTTLPPSKPLPKTTRRLWVVINGYYAIIPGANNGLPQPVSGNESNASMIISFLALLYSDIERASLWRMDVVDELIKYGKAYYKSITKRMKLKKNHYNIVDLPEAIMLGAFRAVLKKRAFLYTGHVADCKNFLDSQLTLAVRQLFESEWEAALLQIDNSVLAIWRDMEFFYVFDPFRRGKAGEVLDSEDFLTKGVACLQMHSNFESFCRILYMKALKMRRGGKFFLHGIRVGCIKPMAEDAEYKNFFQKLQITYPKNIEEPEQPEKKSKKSKKSKPERKYSMESLPEEQRIPEFDDADVVESVLEDIICEILQLMEEDMPKFKYPYKQAEKVLLRSDADYLKALKWKLKHHEDFDNIYQSFPTRDEPPQRAMTLEEELQVESNFESLPDGTWVIFGTSQLPVVDDEMSKLGGLLAGLIAIALSAKYKISTWNSDLIEFALISADSFGEDYKNYEKMLAMLLNNMLPKISIGSNIYSLEVVKVVKSSETRTLRQTVLECFMNYKSIVIICQHFSCIIIRRYNFLYMFIGYPCNEVGYRRFAPGPGCLLRFIELDALIRRIEFGCNPQGCDLTNYVVMAIHVTDVTNVPPERFRKWDPLREDQIYQSEAAKKKEEERLKREKMKFLDDELRKESDRIKKFLDAKEGKCKKPKKICRRAKKVRRTTKTVRRQYYDGEGDEQFYDEEEEEFMPMEEEEEQEEEEPELKHKPGKKLKKEIVRRYKPRPILYGYRMRAIDCLFKIQGSTALDGRSNAVVDEVKPCFFISTLSILYAILRPLNQWTTQRVNRVVESGAAIAIKAGDMTTAFERVIKNVTVDDYDFDIWVKTFEPAGVYNHSLSRKISKATQTRHYLLLQTPNATFAIYHDEFYHLFDPYPSMEKIGEDFDEEEEDDDEKNKKKCTKETKLYGERNTASWVLFADIETLIQYIDERSSSPDWKEITGYKFHVVDILSYKKSPPKKRILQLLTDLSVPMQCNIKNGEDESALCAYNESVSWLDLENCLPVWSRLNRRNTAGRYRNLPITKYRKYDIEIDGRLWSLWGNIHPSAAVFDRELRGKQFLACNVIACIAAKTYRLSDWSPQLLDTIVISGDRYHGDSMAEIQLSDFEFSLENLNQECYLDNIKFNVHLEHVAFGKLYCQPTNTRMNLAEGLMYFFSHFQFGILQCHTRSVAIGRIMGSDGGYFMFDCMARDVPLFPKGQGAAYLLRTRHLQVLLYCIVVTLNIPYYNVTFTLHKVDILREGADVEGEEEEEEREDEQTVDEDEA